MRRFDWVAFGAYLVAFGGVLVAFVLAALMHSAIGRLGEFCIYHLSR